ncbi:MAG: YkvA family protein [Chthoniobacterales bacterium]
MAKRSTKKRDASLRARMESEFSQAVKSARAYVADPARLRALAHEAAEKAAALPKETFQETWAYLQAMQRLIRAYTRGEYRRVPATTLLIIVAALIYIVNPFDFIPDWIPGLGLLDDAFVVGFAVVKTKRTLDEFIAWETRTK